VKKTAPKAGVRLLRLSDRGDIVRIAIDDATWNVMTYNQKVGVAAMYECAHEIIGETMIVVVHSLRTNKELARWSWDSLTLY
jgi:hypothetical protein